MTVDEKARVEDTEVGSPRESGEAYEVFKKTDDGVSFRGVGWFKACIIFTKVLFATGVLSLPSSLFALGAVGGSFSILGWGLFNTYSFVILGNFRKQHPHCHSIADMAEVAGGFFAKEITGLLFLIGYVLVVGSGILGVSTALNALSHHGACTVWWSLIAAVVIVATASVRKLQHVGWLTYAGFVSIYAAVLIVVIGVTTRERPAAAPQEGPYELGFRAVNNPGFAMGMVASSTIFVSTAGTSAFIPVMSEMRNPKDYKKALYLCMIIVNASYLAFSLVVYRWCGQWVASPSLGVSIFLALALIPGANLYHMQSAGQTIKMVSYGVALIGLVISATIYLHVSISSEAQRSELTLLLDCGQVHLCPYLGQYTPSTGQHSCPLGYLVGMHHYPWCYLLHPQRDYSYLQLPGCPGWVCLLCTPCHLSSWLPMAAQLQPLSEGISTREGVLPPARRNGVAWSFLPRRRDVWCCYSDQGCLRHGSHRYV